MPGFASGVLRKGAQKEEDQPSCPTVQRSRRPSKDTKKKSIKGQQQQAGKVPSGAAIAEALPKLNVRRKTTSQNKQTSEGADEDKITREEDLQRVSLRKLPSKTPPLEQTTATTEQIAAIKELQDLGRIDIEFEEMRSAAKEFSLHAASILAKGALEEFSTHLRKYVAGNATREHFDRNPQKNRYRDVVCGDYERVVLNYLPAHGHYIHANHVRGPPLPLDQHFILTQAPINVIDFWRMVWQERAGAIVMLCDITECNKVKCIQYWPLCDNETMRLEAIDLAITTTRRYVHSPGFVTTFLSVRHLKLNIGLSVYHHQWKGWPDRGVPNRHDIVLKILQLIRGRHKNTSTIIHCSAGIGRSGTLVATELAIQTLIANKTPNLINIVKSLRQRRISSVQTDLQYAFIYKVVLAFIATKEPDSETSKGLDDYLDTFTSLTQNMKLEQRT